MKIVTKPAQKEEAESYCDFTGEKLVDYVPAEMKMYFGYGSKHDGFSLTLDLSDGAAESLLEFIKKNLHDKTKEELKGKLVEAEDMLYGAMDARSWEECDRYGNSKHLLEYLIKEE